MINIELPKFEEIDTETTRVLNENNFSCHKILNPLDFKLNILRSKISRQYPVSDSSTLTIVLELLQMGEISQLEAISEFENMSDLGKDQYLRQRIINKYISKPNFNLENKKEIVKYLLSLENQTNKFYTGNINEILSLGIILIFNPSVFSDYISKFWENKKESLSSYDWWFLIPVLEYGKKETEVQYIISDIIENQKYLKSFKTNFNKIYKLSDKYDPSNFTKLFPEHLDYINKEILIPPSIIELYNEALDTIIKNEIYDFPIEKIEATLSKPISINELPYAIPQEKSPIHALSIHGLSFYLYTSDDVQESPVPYEYYFEGFRKIYSLLNIQCELVCDSALSIDNKSNYNGEIHKLNLIHENVVYSILFYTRNHGYICLNHFLALNNGFLKKINSTYRFMKVNNYTHVVLINKRNIERIKKMLLKYDY